MEQKKGQLPTVSPLPEDREIVEEIRAEVARLREEVYSPAQVISGEEKEIEQSGEEVMPVQSPAEVRPMAEMPDLPPVLPSEDKPEVETPETPQVETPDEPTVTPEIPKEAPQAAPEIETPETPQVETPAEPTVTPEVPKEEFQSEPEMETPPKKLSRKERWALKKQNRRKKKHPEKAAVSEPEPVPSSETDETESMELPSFEDIKNDLREQKPEQSEPTSSFSYLYDNTDEVPLSSISQEERQREREERALQAMEEALAEDPKAQKELAAQAAAEAAESKVTLEEELERHPGMEEDDPSIIIDGFDYQQWRRTTESVPKLTDKFLEQHAREEAAKAASQNDTLEEDLLSADPEVAEIAALMEEALSPGDLTEVTEEPRQQETAVTAENTEPEIEPDAVAPAEEATAAETEPETKPEVTAPVETESIKEEAAPAETEPETKTEETAPVETESTKEEATAAETKPETKPEVTAPVETEAIKEEATPAETEPETKTEENAPVKTEAIKEEAAPAETEPEIKPEETAPVKTEAIKEEAAAVKAEPADKPDKAVPAESEAKKEEAVAVKAEPEIKTEAPASVKTEKIKEEAPAAKAEPADKPDKAIPAESEAKKEEAPAKPDSDSMTEIFSDSSFEAEAAAAELSEEEDEPVQPAIHFVPVADPERYRLNTMPVRTFRLEESNAIFLEEIARYAHRAHVSAKKAGKTPTPASTPAVTAPAAAPAESPRPAEKPATSETPVPKQKKKSSYGKKVSLHPGAGGLRAAIAAAIQQAESESQSENTPAQEEDDSSKPSDLGEPKTSSEKNESVKETETTATENTAPEINTPEDKPEAAEPKEEKPSEDLRKPAEPDESNAIPPTEAPAGKEEASPEPGKDLSKDQEPEEKAAAPAPSSDDKEAEAAEPAGKTPVIETQETEKPAVETTEATPQETKTEKDAPKADTSAPSEETKAPDTDHPAEEKPSDAPPSGASQELFSDTKFEQEASEKAAAEASVPNATEAETSEEPASKEEEPSEKHHGFPFPFGKGKKEQTEDNTSESPSEGKEPEEKEPESAADSEKKPGRKFPFGFGAAEKSAVSGEKFDTKGTEEYEPGTDPKKISNELKTAIREMHIRIGVTGLFTAALLALGLICEKWIPNTVTPYPYLILNLIFLLIPAGICFKTIYNGIKALFSLQGNTDSGISVAVLATIIQGIALLFSPGMVTHYEVHLYTSIAVGMLLINSIGKLSMLNRVSRNFIFVTSSDTKCSVEIYEDMSTAIQLAKGCVSEAPRIAYQHKNRFLKHFLQNSYAGDPSIRTSQLIAPIALVASVVLCIVTIIITGSFIVGLTALSLATCISAPIASLLCVNLPVAKLCALARRHGAMLTGYSAVEKLSSTNAVMLDSTDLFPKDSVSLATFKSYSNKKIEQTVHNAAAVVSNIGGTLRDLFEGVITSQKEMLPMATDITYYEERGMAGLVSGKRILLGNLSMMEENHISVPREDQTPSLNKNQSTLYLAEDGELIAMLIVSYEPDRSMIHEMQRLEHCGIAAIIRTLDPNLTPEFLSKLFLVSESALKVLPAELGDACDDALQTETDEAEALLATRGQAFSMMRMLSACVRQKHNISVSVTLQIVSVVIGFILVAFLSCYAGLQQLSTLAILIYEAFWLAAIIIIPKLRKP